MGEGLRLSRVRAGLRVRVAARARGVSDLRGPSGIEQGPGHRDRRVPGPFRREARLVLERAAQHSARPRLLSRGAAGAFQSQFRPATREHPAACGRERDCVFPVSIRSRASWSVRSSWCMRARRRCASSRNTNLRRWPGCRSKRRPAAGNGCTEAPRGILYHRYEFDGAGCVKSARIVPPTAQNQKRIEEDLRAFIPQLIGQPDEEVTWRCEQAVRNYDPCISCATHAVKVRIEREP